MKPFFIGNIEIKTPIIQGGMGVGISLSGLASAVANEGGIGVISCAGLGLLYPKGKGDYTEKCICGLKEEIRKARQKTKGIIGVNIMVALSNYAEMVRTAISEKIDVVFAGAGLPLDLPLYLTPESKTGNTQADIKGISVARLIKREAPAKANAAHRLTT
jgi:nitronate monooxygenase